MTLWYLSGHSIHVCGGVLHCTNSRSIAMYTHHCISLDRVSWVCAHVMCVCVCVCVHARVSVQVCVCMYNILMNMPLNNSVGKM